MGGVAEGAADSTGKSRDVSLGHEKPLLINIDPNEKQENFNQTDESGVER